MTGTFCCYRSTYAMRAAEPRQIPLAPLAPGSLGLNGGFWGCPFGAKECDLHGEPAWPHTDMTSFFSLTRGVSGYSEAGQLTSMKQFTR